MKRIVSKMVVQIKSGKRENGKSFCCNLYRKRLIKLSRSRGVMFISAVERVNMAHVRQSRPYSISLGRGAELHVR